MYLPRHFEQNDPDALQTLMREHPLATVVTHAGDGSLTANHVPLVYDPEAGEHGTLRGHVARANPLWREAPSGSAVLAVFQGPQAYVSPSWYASKTETGKVVPTWNYAVVHAHGTLRVIDDAAWLRDFVNRLTDTHEAGRAAPWAVSDAPADYVEQMLKAIVGFEIAVTRLAGKWKVSQNRQAADRDGVARGLCDDGGATMAALVDAGS
jgi:transcriptional regulator